MPADPQDGHATARSTTTGEAEDRAEVLSTDEQAEVPFGHFDDALLTKDLVTLEPKVSSTSSTPATSAPVLVLGVSGGDGREELIRYAGRRRNWVG